MRWPRRRWPGAVLPAALVAAFVPGCGGSAAEAAVDRPGPGTVGVEAPGPTAPVSARDPRTGSLEPAIEGVVRRWVAEAERRSKGKARAANVRVAVHVRELGSDVELAARHADAPLRPASNMKLVTSAAALVLLGSGAEFVTPFEADGAFEGGVLQGDLVVRASGDPVCAPDGDPEVEPRLAAVAEELRRLGLARVAGDVVLDEGSFEEPGPGPAWPDPSQHWTEYCALAGGFTLNGGVLHATIRPRGPGVQAAIAVHPSPHGLRSRYGVLAARRAPLDVRVGATATTVTVQGRMPSERDEFTAEFAHPDPVELFGSVLLERLRRAGIRVDGTVRRARGRPPGRPLAALRSSLDDTLGPINADSRNAVADQLFFALGNAVTGSGTRAGGRAAVARALERLGVPSDGLQQVDGSGLSRDNRVSARQVTALLAAVLARGDQGALFRDSLALAGHTGTLSERMGGTAAEGRVRAKTGWIAGASALSGVADTLDGRAVAFAILVDYPREAGGLNTHCFKPMQDEIAGILVAERGRPVGD